MGLIPFDHRWGPSLWFPRRARRERSTRYVKTASSYCWYGKWHIIWYLPEKRHISSSIPGNHNILGSRYGSVINKGLTLSSIHHYIHFWISFCVSHKSPQYKSWKQRRLHYWWVRVMMVNDIYCTIEDRNQQTNEITESTIEIPECNHVIRKSRPIITCEKCWLQNWWLRVPKLMVPCRSPYKNEFKTASWGNRFGWWQIFQNWPLA